jgi:hypothetical protein
VSRAEALQRVTAEIRRAQAEALGRVGERLDVLLGRLAELDRRLDALQAGARPGTDRYRRLVAETAARNRVRNEAREAAHHLIIQREALGFVRHVLVEQQYPVPPRRELV